MRLQAELRYDATPEQVFAMLLDEGFQRRKCEATGALEHSVAVESGGPGATVMTRRVLPTRDVPDFVRSFIGETLTVVETDEWQAPAADGAREGTVRVEISGAPVRFTGRLRMRPEGEQTVQTIEGDLKASVPLFGGQVERAAEPAIRAAIKVEQQTGAEWLAR